MTLRTTDCLVIGGGVIGLSIAYELAKRGTGVRVIDQQRVGREASWAGAGILPPANRETAVHPYDQMCGLSAELHADWATSLREATGIDTGFRACGGLYLARSAGEAAALVGQVSTWREQQIDAQRLTTKELLELEPELTRTVDDDSIRASYFVPSESQICNPHHLQALSRACELMGVEVLTETAATEFALEGSRLSHVVTDRGKISADKFCVTSGAWSRLLLEKLGVTTGVMPVRGQMIMFHCDVPPVSRVLNEGPRYLVPRTDGRVLVGSSEEEVGYDKGTTDSILDELRTFAFKLLPSVKTVTIEKTWAGLRPGSFDGFPYLGKLPELDNAFVATGHFRSGLFLSPATAIVMSQLIHDEQPTIDLTSFRVGRG